MSGQYSSFLNSTSGYLPLALPSLGSITYNYPSTVRPSGFLYDNGKMIDLNKAVNTGGLSAHIDAAFAINDLGQILAQGTIGNSLETTLLLTPTDLPRPTDPPVLIPEPSTLAIFGMMAGALGLWGVRPRR